MWRLGNMFRKRSSYFSVNLWKKKKRFCQCQRIVKQFLQRMLLVMWIPVWRKRNIAQETMRKAKRSNINKNSIPMEPLYNWWNFLTFSLVRRIKISASKQLQFAPQNTGNRIFGIKMSKISDGECPRTPLNKVEPHLTYTRLILRTPRNYGQFSLNLGKVLTFSLNSTALSTDTL